MMKRIASSSRIESKITLERSFDANILGDIAQSRLFLRICAVGATAEKWGHAICSTRSKAEALGQHTQASGVCLGD